MKTAVRTPRFDTHTNDKVGSSDNASVYSIREVPVSILGRDTDYPDRGTLVILLSSSHATAGIVA
jgi:hypothetical protein